MDLHLEVSSAWFPCRLGWKVTRDPVYHKDYTAKLKKSLVTPGLKP